MERVFSKLESKRAFVFLGEAGSGKSEIAISFSRELARRGREEVCFFDLDMTKPLFRARDVAEALKADGVQMRFEEQFMDAPTLVGGVGPLLREGRSTVVMDVGGDYIGARSIGGFAPQLNRPTAAVFYVVNAYRPWSDTIEHIDDTLGKILGVSHVRLDQLTLVCNPNNGAETTLDEFLEGYRRTRALLDPYLPVCFACAREEIAAGAAAAVDVPVLPLRLALTYPWLEGGEGLVSEGPAHI